MRRRTLLTTAAILAPQGIFPALAQSSAPPPEPAAGDRISRIMTSDMLQIRVAYLETITGPARRVRPRIGGRGQERIYRLDGCDLAALTPAKDVSGYRLRLSATCTFDMQRVVPNFRRPVRAHQLTFGMLAESFGTTFLPSCLIGCGNAADPVFSVFGESSRADDYVEVIGTAFDNNEQVAAAAYRLLGAAKRLMSEDDIMDGHFNCHPRYQQLALQAFRDVRIQEITLGFELGPEEARC